MIEPKEQPSFLNKSIVTSFTLNNFIWNVFSLLNIESCWLGYNTIKFYYPVMTISAMVLNYLPN